ncbi:MAG: hypothetical protein M1814_006830 [Vezdaea aestivalis]|nr:MAG: hypothetical protein M1814_006830 [Vezdaea aestivalis]
MRLNLTIHRNGLAPCSLVWTPEGFGSRLGIPVHASIDEFLQQVNEIVPLESDDWGLEDYVVSVNGPWHCLHFHELWRAFRDGDQVLIEPLKQPHLRDQIRSGRRQISADGRALYDGVVFGGRFNGPSQNRPAIHIPPRKRARLIEGPDSESRESMSLEPHSLSLLTAKPEEEDSEEDDDDFEDDAASTSASEDNESDASSSEEEHSNLSASDNDDSDASSKDDIDEKEDDHSASTSSPGSNPSPRELVKHSELKPQKQGSRSEKAATKAVSRKTLKKADKSLPSTQITKSKKSEKVVKFLPVTHNTPTPSPDTAPTTSHLSKKRKHQSSSPESAIMPIKPLKKVLKKVRAPAPAEDYTSSEDLHSTDCSTCSSGAGSESDSQSSRSRHDKATQLKKKKAKKPGRLRRMVDYVAISQKERIAKKKKIDNDRSSSSDASSYDTDSDSYSEWSESDPEPEGGPGPWTIAENAEKKGKGGSSKDSEREEQDSKEAKKEKKKSKKEEKKKQGVNEEKQPKEEAKKAQKKSRGQAEDQPSESAETRILSTKKRSGNPCLTGLEPSREIKQAKHNEQPPVPPGEGKGGTKSRNQRRKRAQFIKRQKLEGRSTPEALVEWEERQSGSPNYGTTNQNVLKAMSEGLQGGASEDIEDARQKPLDAIVSDEGSAPYEAAEVSLSPQRADVAEGDDAPNMLSNEQSPDERRPRLDMNSSRRMVFASLGITDPARAERLRAAKENIQGSIAATNESTSATQCDKQDLEAIDWRSKITLSAQECLDEDVKLSTPPFPFVQRWDPQQQTSGSGESLSKKSKKRKRNTKVSAEDHSVADTDADGPVPKKVHRSSHDNRAVVWQLDQDTKAAIPIPALAQNPKDDAFPPLPSNMTTLRNLSYSDIREGTLFAFKQMAMSANWTPEISDFKSARCCEVSSDGDDLRVEFAGRDIAAKEVEFDEETGDRIYSKFEMPEYESGDTLPPGQEWVKFSDLIEPKLIRAAKSQSPKGSRNGSKSPSAIEGQSSSAAGAGKTTIPRSPEPSSAETRNAKSAVTDKIIPSTHPEYILDSQSVNNLVLAMPTSPIQGKLPLRSPPIPKSGLLPKRGFSLDRGQDSKATGSARRLELERSTALSARSADPGEDRRPVIPSSQDSGTFGHDIRQSSLPVAFRV